jgi:hypothetical protein
MIMICESITVNGPLHTHNTHTHLLHLCMIQIHTSYTTYKSNTVLKINENLIGVQICVFICL